MSDFDVELYFQINQGDKAALEQLYDRYERLLFSFAYRMIGQKELAEEAVQEVFIKLWTKKGMYDSSKGKFSSWLLTITRNTCIDQMRKQKTVSQLENEGSLSSGQSSVEDLVEWKEEGTQLRHAIANLGDEQRKMVELFYFKGLSQQNIADTCEIPLGTVKGRIRLALQHLRKMLSKVDERSEMKL